MRTVRFHGRIKGSRPINRQAFPINADQDLKEPIVMTLTEDSPTLELDDREAQYLCSLSRYTEHGEFIEGPWQDVTEGATSVPPDLADAGGPEVVFPEDKPEDKPVSKKLSRLTN